MFHCERLRTGSTSEQAVPQNWQYLRIGCCSSLSLLLIVKSFLSAVNITLARKKNSQSCSSLSKVILSVSSGLSYLQPSGQVLSDTGRKAIKGALPFFKDGLQKMVTYNWRTEFFHLDICLYWSVMGLPPFLAGWRFVLDCAQGRACPGRLCLVVKYSAWLGPYHIFHSLMSAGCFMVENALPSPVNP